MALLQRNFSKVQNLGTNLIRRGVSKTVNVKNNVIKKSVFISQSTDTYVNLALENWIYKNFDFNNHHVLMLYFNESSVLIGKNQNPWVETNVTGLTEITDNGTQLARRIGGGPAMYNDKGILNMTFFTPRDRYNHNYNMEVISRALFRKFNLRADISSRNNLTMHNMDISTFGSKIGTQNAYLNCSMLVDVNKVNLMDALYRDEDGVKTNAMSSSRSKYLNLSELDPKINVNNVLSAVGWEYMRTSACSLKDGGIERANQQKGFQMVNPTENWFPGITEIRDNLSQWDWCYGKTPTFSVSRTYPVSAKHPYNIDGFDSDLRVTLTVKEGVVDDVTLFVPQGLSNSGVSGEANVITSLKGRKYTDNLLDSLEKQLGISNICTNAEKFNGAMRRHAVLSV